MSTRPIIILRQVICLITAVVCGALVGSSAYAQQTGRVVSGCGGASYSIGATNYVTLDTAGATCVSSAPPATLSPALGSATPLLASSLVVTGAHNLAGFHVTTASTGYALVYDGTTSPSDGAVTPRACFYVPPAVSPATTTTISMANTPAPVAFSVGIVIVFSTTGCFTQTKSATAYIAMTYQ